MSVDDIAKQMTDALNEASIAHKAEEEAKREAEKKAKLAEAEAAKREEKREYLAAEVARTMKDYLDEFYPNLGSALDPKEFADSFIKSIESIVEFKNKLEELAEGLDPDDLNWLDDFLK
jgi:hypothetical protein